MTRLLAAAATGLALVACSSEPSTAQSSAAAVAAGQAPITTQGKVAAKPFAETAVATFSDPWAMVFLPDGRMFVTEKGGTLKLGMPGSTMANVAGVPRVDAGGQGGLGDVILHPDFAQSRMVYLSWAEAGPKDTRGAVVGRATLAEAGGAARLDGLQIVWRQDPKVTGRGHFGHRLAFGPDRMLYISSGDRQKFTPAQDMNASLGKIVRLTDAGGVPSDNPFYNQGAVKAQIWVSGLRNPLGIAFDAQGRLWEQEMGPEGGDEINLIVKGKNYGYPIVSNGRNYNASTDDIPDHATRPDFEAPKVSWNPAISPAGLLHYTGTMFPDWKGNLFLGGLSSQALVRVKVDGDRAEEAARYEMGARIREVEQGPDGAIWLLEDGKSGGRLLKLTPKG